MVSMVSRLTSSFTQLHSACETSPRHASDFRQPETPAKQDRFWVPGGSPWWFFVVYYGDLTDLTINNRDRLWFNQ